MTDTIEGQGPKRPEGHSSRQSLLDKIAEAVPDGTDPFQPTKIERTDEPDPFENEPDLEEE